jgi:hypothetical protein
MLHQCDKLHVAEERTVMAARLDSAHRPLDNGRIKPAQVIFHAYCC